LADPFYKLEHEGEDTAKGKKQAPLLVRLQEAADMKHFDSYARNKALRAQLRVCFSTKSLSKFVVHGRTLHLTLYRANTMLVALV